jgi:hypothetical protein
LDKGVWLIRTKDLFISRPLTDQELIKKIEKGDLNPLDEICAGNGYWFGLHEAEEVRKHLGDIDLSKLSSGIEIEITSATETSTIKKTLILDVPKSWGKEEPKSILTPPAQYNLTETGHTATAASAAKRRDARPYEPELERQWTPAIVFAAIFVVTLVFLWMNSD